MSRSKDKVRRHPWRDALIATTGLSVFVLAATMLWNSGHQEWAFALSFVSVWVLISISWSNVEFTEETGVLLARIMDQNFDEMHNRVRQLEDELSALRHSNELTGQDKSAEVLRG